MLPSSAAVAPLACWPRTRRARALILLAGAILPQVLLYGPSLIGTRILLPLDLLALPRFYLPASPAYRSVVPHDVVFTDQVLNYEFSRRFATAEFRAGRLPLWDPYSFAGSPFAHFGKYCPLYLLYYLFPSPVSLAWIQLLKAIVAATGCYLFFRRALGVGFGPAAVGAWCYPLTGFSIFWQGYPITLVTAFLPWALLATDCAVRRPRGLGLIGLALATCLTITAGHLDIAGQVLLASGLYACWAAWEAHGRRLSRRLASALAAALAGWVLGFLLAGPYLLPLLDYARTGARMRERAGGEEERPPVGLSALPLTVLPDAYGSLRRGFVSISAETQPESAAACYAGLVATLLAAPLAGASRRHRSAVVCWLALGFLGLAWTLDVPGVVPLLRLPGLNLMSHNRLVFLTSFAMLTLAVIGLEVLREGGPRWRGWFLLTALVPAVLGVWCLSRAVYLPATLTARLDETLHRLSQGGPLARGLPDAAQLRHQFQLMYAQGAFLAGVALLGWLLIRRARPRPWLAPALAAVMLADLLWFAHGINPQADPALYYPPIPALEQLRRAPAGRVLGIDCLPANLAPTVGLHDIRGYDGIDPQSLVELLATVRDTNYPAPSFAVTQWYVPVFHGPRGGIARLPQGPDGRPTAANAGLRKYLRLPAVLGMLGVRYLIFRGSPPVTIQPVAQSDDYWVFENPRALPRVFIPRRVVPAPSQKAQTLALLATADFDPRTVAYVDTPPALPSDCRGVAGLEDEQPKRVTITATMETPGLLVLADRWTADWQATVNGRPAPVLRANHVLRAVALPAGSSRVVFTYRPASFTLGLILFAVAVAVLFALFLFSRRLSHQGSLN